MAHGKGGGKLMAQIAAEGDLIAGLQPITELCARCDWRYDGAAADGRQAFRAHLADAHPEVKPKRIRRPGLSSWNKTDLNQRDEAMVVVAQRVADAAKRESRASELEDVSTTRGTE